MKTEQEWSEILESTEKFTKFSDEDFMKMVARKFYELEHRAEKAETSIVELLNDKRDLELEI